MTDPTPKDLATFVATKVSVRISKVYKEATSLYLTRRLAESLSTIQALLIPCRSQSDMIEQESKDAIQAPIASASRKSRTKVWCFYLTLLNAIAELDPVEGREAFGSKEWRSLVHKVQDGSVWDDVVDIGYGGVESNVDAEVVSNLYVLERFNFAEDDC